MRNGPSMGARPLPPADATRASAGDAGVPGPLPAGRGTRLVKRRRSVPSGRAAAGGALVAVSMLASFSLWSRDRHHSVRTVVAAARSVPAGATLRAADLATLRVTLPGPLDDQLVLDPASAVGKVISTSLERGDVIASSMIRSATSGDAVHEVSLKLDPDRRLGGELRVGDRVSVVATTGPCTAVIASDAKVRSVGTVGSSLGAPSAVVVGLLLPTSADVVAVVHAARTGEVTLARGADGEPARCTS